METFDNFKSIHVVISGHEGVQEEELADDIDHIHDLDEQEESRKEGSATFAADDTADPTDTLPHCCVTVPAVVSLTIQPFIDMGSQMFNGLLSSRWRSQLSLLGHVDNFVQVDTTVWVHQLPEHIWKLEEKGLECQNQRNPLIVGDFSVLSFTHVSWERLRE